MSKLEKRLESLENTLGLIWHPGDKNHKLYSEVNVAYPDYGDQPPVILFSRDIVETNRKMGVSKKQTAASYWDSIKKTIIQWKARVKWSTTA